MREKNPPRLGPRQENVTVWLLNYNYVILSNIGSCPREKKIIEVMSVLVLNDQEDTHKSECEVGEMRKLTPLGTVSKEKSAFNSLPNRCVAKPKLHVCL